MSKTLYFLTQLVLLIMTTTACAQPSLITPAELAKDSSWIILDCRPEKLYNKGHLPAALSLSWEILTTTDKDEVRYRILPPEELTEKLDGMGITEQSKIVLYGDADQSWGSEGWGAWMLAWLGHQGPVRLLDGGISGRQQAGLPMEEEGLKKRGETTYVVDLQAEVNITVKELQEHKEQYVVVDVRSTLEWLRGHLPGAVHISWKKFYHGPERRPLGPKQFNALLAAHGVDLNRPVVYYCTAGIRSGYAWLVHSLSGQGKAINFEGGIEAWSKLGSQSSKWLSW